LWKSCPELCRLLFRRWKKAEEKEYLGRCAERERVCRQVVTQCILEGKQVGIKNFMKMSYGKLSFFSDRDVELANSVTREFGLAEPAK
jgi:hypothetical protein